MIRSVRLVTTLAIAALAAGCSGAPSTQTTTSSAPSAAATSGDRILGPIVVDTDLGADDIVAIGLVVASGADVRAVTVAGTGLVHCGFGVPHLQMLLARLGAPGVPVGCGREEAAPPAVAFPEAWRSAGDNAYALSLVPSAPRATAPAAELLASVARDADRPLTVLELGPWTNLADALTADPALAGRIAGIHAMGGTLDRPGNAYRDGKPWDARVEANLAADPRSVDAVLRTSVPVALVPLDATDRVPVPADVAARLLADHSAAAADLAFELFARNPFLAGGDGQYLWDETAAISLLEPRIGTWTDETLAVSADATAPGGLTRATGGRSVRVRGLADGASAGAAILAGLRRGSAAAAPFAVSGPVRLVVDGTRGEAAAQHPPTGRVLLAVENRTETSASLLLLAAAAPHRLEEIGALARTFRVGVDEVPTWVTTVASLAAPARGSAYALAELPTTRVLPVCGVGDPAAPTLVVGSPLEPEASR